MFRENPRGLLEAQGSPGDVQRTLCGLKQVQKSPRDLKEFPREFQRALQFFHTPDMLILSIQYSIYCSSYLWISKVGLDLFGAFSWLCCKKSPASRAPQQSGPPSCQDPPAVRAAQQVWPTQMTRPSSFQDPSAFSLASMCWQNPWATLQIKIQHQSPWIWKA